MGFKKKSYPVHRDDLETFAKQVVVLAVLIDSGFMTHWPHEWTSAGNGSRRRHTTEGRGYNANSVFDDANRQLYYARRPSADTHWDPEQHRALSLMNGEARDAEAID